MPYVSTPAPRRNGDLLADQRACAEALALFERLEAALLRQKALDLMEQLQTAED